MKKVIKNNTDKNKGIVIYQAKNGAIELRGDFEHGNIWANRMQMSRIFGVNTQSISKHIHRIYKEKELRASSTSSKMELVQNESGRVVKREVDIYNLDVLIAVGYRINSIVGTRFRQWATSTLKSHVIKGYSINRNKIAKNYGAFMKSVAEIQNFLPDNISFDPKTILDLVKEFSVTWMSLEAYDKESLSAIGTTKKSIKITGEELSSAICDFKDELIKNGDATEIFAQERKTGVVEGIVGNIMQSFDGQALYKTIEEKAVHLLYFMVKDHPFIDGNKRSGAFAFIWFLRKAKIKKSVNINPNALTALTLLIAESNPDKKEQMIALVIQMLR